MWLTKKGKKTAWILGALLVAVICFAFSFTFVGKTQLRAKAIGMSVAYSKATETTKLTNLAGATVCGTIGAAPGENISEVSITDAPKNFLGNYYYVIDNRGYTIFPAFTFEEPIKVADIDCLAFNICAYWASNHSPYGGYREGEGFVWTTKGIFLLGETSDGTEGVLLDPYFPTQSWTYWKIMGGDLNKLANDDGEITGFRIAAAIDTYGWTPVNQYAFDLGEVCVLETVDVTYMDGDTVLKTEKLAKGVDVVENYQAKKLGQELKGWKTADGEYYTDFSSPVTSSLTLYADFQSSTILDAYIISDSEHYQCNNQTTITSIGGKDYDIGGEKFPSDNLEYLQPELESNQPVQGQNALKFRIHPWGFRIYQAVEFSTKVKADEIDAITFRINAHLSTGATYGGWLNGDFFATSPGIWLLGAQSDGSKGIMFPYDITQDKWINLTVTGDDLLKLADEDGYISGYRFASGIIAMGSDYLHGGLNAFVLVDYVMVNFYDTNVVYKDGDTVLKTEDKLGFVGEIEYIPKKEGFLFFAWRDELGKYVPMGTVPAQNLVLTAEWKTLASAAQIAQTAGLYQTNGGDYVGVFSDGEIMLPNSMQDYKNVVYCSDGTVCDYTDGLLRLLIDLNECSREEYCTLTFDFVEVCEEKRVMIEKGELVTPPVFNQTGVEIVGWSTEQNSSVLFDFNSAIENDLTLYAVYEIEESYYVLNTAKDDYIFGGNTTLKSINGTISMSNVTDAIQRNMLGQQLDETMSVGSDDGYAYGMFFVGWGFTYGTPVVFDKKVPVSEIDGLTFRIWAHLSPKPNYAGFAHGGQGYRIYGIDADGSTSGVLIPLTIKQDQWVDFVLTKEQVMKLADKDGYFSGFMLGSAIIVSQDNEDNGYGSALEELYSTSAYIFVDTVLVNYRKDVVYFDGVMELYKETVLTGEMISKEYFPEKEGYAFAGWLKNGVKYSETQKIYQNIQLTAKWVKKVAIPEGRYVKGDQSFVLHTNGVMERVHATDYTFKMYYTCLLGEDGVLYVYNEEDGLEKITLADWSKVETVKVVLCNGSVETVIFVEKGGKLNGTELSKSGYLFAGYLLENGAEFDLNTPLQADITLSVRWEIDEETAEAYNRFVGSYYDKFSQQIIVLGENKKATVDGATVDYVISVSGEVQIGTLSGTIVDGYLTIDGATYNKLEDCYVSFFVNGGTAIPSQKISASNPKAVKPTDPTKEGYKFLGWTMTKNGDEFFDFNTVIADSIELYAKWEKISVDDNLLKQDGDANWLVPVLGGVGLVSLLAITVFVVVKSKKKD